MTIPLLEFLSRFSPRPLCGLERVVNCTGQEVFAAMRAERGQNAVRGGMFSMHLVINRPDRCGGGREHPEMTVAQWSGQGAIQRAILLKWVHEADAVL